MKELSGWEILKQIKAKYKEMKVVMVTVLGEEEHRNRKSKIKRISKTGRSHK